MVKRTVILVAFQKPASLRYWWGSHLGLGFRLPRSPKTVSNSAKTQIEAKLNSKRNKKTWFRNYYVQMGQKTWEEKHSLQTCNNCAFIIIIIISRHSFLPYASFHIWSGNHTQTSLASNQRGTFFVQGDTPMTASDLLQHTDRSFNDPYERQDSKRKCTPVHERRARLFSENTEEVPGDGNACREVSLGRRKGVGCRGDFQEEPAVHVNKDKKMMIQYISIIRRKTNSQSNENED